MIMTKHLDDEDTDIMATPSYGFAILLKEYVSEKYLAIRFFPSDLLFAQFLKN